MHRLNRLVVKKRLNLLRHLVSHYVSHVLLLSLPKTAREEGTQLPTRHNFVGDVLAMAATMRGRRRMRWTTLALALTRWLR